MCSVMDFREGRVGREGCGARSPEKEFCFHGQKDKKEMIELLHKADVFIRPSRSEGLGNSFLEAMAAGLPIIGTEVGGIPDFLFDPKTHKEKATGLFCTTLRISKVLQTVCKI
jgi:glycosyltransferase involved in cell wall biosynthesis